MKRVRKSLIALPLLLGLFSLSACDFFGGIVDYFNDRNETVVNAKGIRLNTHELTGSLNNSYKIECIFNPTNTTNKKVTWTSSNTSVCTVNDGNVNCIALGEATITAVSEDGGFTDSCDVTVVTKPMTGISLNKNSMTIKPGKSRTLSAVFTPSDCSDKEVVWSSSNSSVVSVDQNGVVTASALADDGDTATITLRAKNYMFSDTCEVTVLESTGDIEKTTMNWDYTDYANYSAYGSSYCPTKGNVKLLVIPVWFNDSASRTGISLSRRDEVRDDIRKTYFGTEAETGWHSVKTFYEAESSVDGESLINITGTVSEWYDCGLDSDTYKSDPNGSLTDAFAKRATDWYFDNHPSDNRRNYDSNNDGIIDGVMIIYAHPDYSSLSNQSYSNFWAYCHWCNGNKNTSAPEADPYFWASYDFMYGSRYKIGNYGGGDNVHSIIDAHTYIHEMGHVFGLDDYYDYSTQKNPAGCFSMQDYNVGGHDPFSLVAFGWAKPYIPTDSCEIKIKPFQTNHDVILLTPQMNTYGSPFDEYILLEYYSPTGLNALDTTYAYKGSVVGVNNYGIRVWHVDARVVGWYGPTKNDVDILTLGSNIKYPGGYRCIQAFKNSYFSSSEYGNNYCTALGSAYSEYNLLQLIRNDTNAEVFTGPNGRSGVVGEHFENRDLFKEGDNFTISKFRKQFVNGAANKLNSGDSLGFTFNVKSMTNAEAVIEITSL